MVSVGSTPTAHFAEKLDGVTEVRAGVFVFFDLVMAGIGVCRVEDIALSVLATVNGHRADKGWTLIDAGWMAMSRDRGTAKQPLDQGYGLVCDLDGRPIPDLIVVDTHQEHGVIAHRSGGKAPALPVGTRLRILPNHACATGAQHEGYNVVEGEQGSAGALGEVQRVVEEGSGEKLTEIRSISLISSIPHGYEIAHTKTADRSHGDFVKVDRQ